MKHLEVVWPRLVADGRTCERCGATGHEVERAVETLRQALAPLGIEPVLITSEIGTNVFRDRPRNGCSCAPARRRSNAGLSFYEHSRHGNVQTRAATCSTRRRCRASSRAREASTGSRMPEPDNTALTTQPYGSIPARRRSSCSASASLTGVDSANVTSSSFVKAGSCSHINGVTTCPAGSPPCIT
ncbi:MAG: DUF2703 domain-containing protein [Acidimicrobiia bacterium]